MRKLSPTTSSSSSPRNAPHDLARPDEGLDERHVWSAQSEWNDPTELRMLRLAVRRPAWILFLTLLCVGAALAYLRNATPLYTATARLRVQQDDPQALGAPLPEHGIDQTTSFLNAELAVITSGPVLEVAVDDLMKNTPEALPKSPAIAQLRKSMRAMLGRKDGIITVQIDAPAPATATAQVAAIVNGYVAYESRVRDQTNQHLLDLLLQERKERAAQADATSARLAEVLKSSGRLSVTDLRAAEDLSNLRSGLRAAHQETETAGQFHQEAMAGISGDPDLRRQFELRKGEGALRGVEIDGGSLRAAIAGLEMELAKLTRNRGPQHPQVLETQTQLKGLRVQYAAATYARLALAQTREEELARLVQDQQARLPMQAEQASQYVALDVALKRQERQLDALEEKIVELKARKGTAGRNITILDPAAASALPTKPEQLPILAIGAVGGLVLGIGAAWCREMQSAGSARRRAMAAKSPGAAGPRGASGKIISVDSAEPADAERRAAIAAGAAGAEAEHPTEQMEQMQVGGKSLESPPARDETPIGNASVSSNAIHGGTRSRTSGVSGASLPKPLHAQAQSRWVRRLENQ